MVQVPSFNNGWLIIIFIVTNNTHPFCERSPTTSESDSIMDICNKQNRIWVNVEFKTAD